MTVRIALLTSFLCAACACTQATRTEEAARSAPPPLPADTRGAPARQEPLAPVVDHHQHLLSPAAASLLATLLPRAAAVPTEARAAQAPASPASAVHRPVDGAALVEMLDAAGIGRAVVLSNAYFFDGGIPFAGDARPAVRAENDWTAGQVARFPGRLVAFCSFNPMAEYALDELERCARRHEFRGVKLHLGTSLVDLTRPEHAAKVRRVFEAANRLRLPILVHLAHSPAYGARHTSVVLEQLLPAAPQVPVVIAHLWGGAGYVDEALGVFADAIAAGHPATRNLYFDVAQISLVEGRSPENLRRMVERMRQIGFDRLLYASDGPWGNGLPPGDVWADFRSKLPLSDEELRRIASNVAPFLH